MRPLHTSAIIGMAILLCLAILFPIPNPLLRLNSPATSQQTAIQLARSNNGKQIPPSLLSSRMLLRDETSEPSLVTSLTAKARTIIASPRQTQQKRHFQKESKAERDEFEEEEEEDEDRANPGYQEQLLMMLRDPATGVIPEDMGFREREFVRSLPSRGDRVREQGKNKSIAELEASSLTWQARGPLNIGGRTRTVAIDVSNENIIIAAGVGGGGIWRSSNKGQSWTRTTSNPQAPCVTAIVQDKRAGKQNIWYAGTGEFYSSGFPTQLQGILKSVDGGLTWQSLTSTAGLGTIKFIYSMVTKPTNLVQDEVVAAASGGIMRSIDGGTTWTNVLPTSSVFARTHVAISSTGIYYAVISDANRKVYRSVDGVTWTDISPANFQTMTQTSQRGVLAVAPNNPNVVYMVFSQPGYGTGGMLFFKYDYLFGDGSGSGGTWTNRTASVMQVSGLASGSYNGYCLSLAVHPQNENVVFLGSISLYRSMDGFQTASQVDLCNNTHSDHHAMAFFSDGRAVEATDGGTYLSLASTLQAGTVQFSSLSSGYINSQFYHIAIDEKTNGSAVVMGGMQDNGTYLTATGGLTAWQSTGGGDGAVSAIGAYGTDKMVYSSYQNGKIYSRKILTSTGALQTYSNTSIDPVNATGQLFIHPYILDPNSDSVMYYPAGTSLWRHNNVYSIPASGYTGIAGWTQFPGIAQRTITTLSAAKGATTRIYLGTSGGNVYRIDDARTGTPTAIDVSLGKGFPTGGYVQSIAIDPTDANRAIVVFSNYNVQSLFLTADAGNSWQPIGGNLEQFPDGSGNGPACIAAAIVNYQGNKTYFVGTSSGLYSTTALNGSSTSWTLENGVPPGVAVMHIAKRDIDGMVAVATHGSGVYSTSLGGVPPVSTVSLTGFVRDNNSPANPIQGVTITLNNGAQAVTDASGAYTFNNLPKAVYSVTVTLPNGYYAATKTVLKDLSLQSGTQDFTLIPMQITGKVTLNGAGLANVSVSAGAAGTALTNALGIYTISKVPSGSYTVTPTLAGYTFTPVTQTVTLSNVPSPPAPAVYGIASNINFTATQAGSFTVTPQTITVAAVGQSNISITVTGNVTWTASSNQAWATITPQSGTNNGTITLNVSANPNTTQRTASITVSGGGINRLVSITQSAGAGTLAAPIATAASNIAGAGSLMNFTANWQSVSGATGYRIDISANSTFTLLVANNLFVSGLSYTALSWVLQPYYYRVRAESGTLTSANSNVIVVTPPAAASLNVSPQTVTLTASQLTTSASITANVAWTASSNQSWVTLQQTSGNGNGTLNFTISTNTTTSARTAIITISGGGITRTIAISQSGTVASLTVSPVAFAPSSAGISNFPVTVTANVAWTVVSNQAWATVSPSSGTNNGTFSLSVAPNATTTQRTAAITISGGGISQTIIITQAGAAGTSVLNTNVFQINAGAVPVINGAYPVSVTANVAWTASSNQAWVTVSPASGTGDANVIIQVQTNTTTQQRTAVVTFIGGGITKTVTVIQAAAVTSVLNTNVFQINAGAVPVVNGAYPVSVTANVAWTASSNQAWVTVSPASGTGDANVIIQVQTNTTTQQRTAVVTFVGGGITKTVTVIQSGAASTLTAPTITFITVLGTTSFQINWQALSGAASYQATIALDNAFTQGVINGTSTGTSYAATGLTAGTIYYYRVRAVAADGTVGAWTSVLSYTTPPNAPTALALTNVSATSFTFNWTRVTSATRYDGEVSASTSFSPLRAAFGTSVGNPVATTMTMTITNPVLTPGATYYYRVKASIGSSVSAYSNVVAFTVPALVLTLKTSPNPSADVLRVDVDIAETSARTEPQEPLIVRLLDARGFVLQERTLSGSGSASTEFDVHTLHPGTYFVEVRSESGVMNLRRTEKFIKQ